MEQIELTAICFGIAYLVLVVLGLALLKSISDSYEQEDG